LTIFLKEIQNWSAVGWLINKQGRGLYKKKRKNKEEGEIKTHKGRE
jgi:hypothetical protein